MSLFASFDSKTVYLNSPKSLYMEKSIQLGQGSLGSHGELVVLTGKHTGRSANDKYVVREASTEKQMWWENNLGEMSPAHFETLKQDVEAYLKTKNELFATERSIGHEKHLALNIEFISEMPSAAFFTQYMFKGKAAQAESTYKILHAPFLKLEASKYGLKNPTVVVTSFEQKLTIIVGTLYAGEIKKSMFSIMNFLLPQKGILPMHAGANLSVEQKETSVFFGLSGTGKTTLSTDEQTLLIGDDEHGLSPSGVFNFEGGCYAKTSQLSAASEPGIFKASSQFSSFLENVKMDPVTRKIDFTDDSLTENGRSSYPLEFISERVASSEGPMPKNLFFLSADAFGVLPPVSKLSAKQAMEFFVLGYTAKLAGTEIGVKSPKAAFSPCFGAPFMLQRPEVYAALLKNYIEKYPMNVWLINTGWTGGGFGEGQRFSIKITREIIRSIQAGEMDQAAFVPEEFFGLQIPQKVRSLGSEVLNPALSWKSPVAYQEAAKKLAQSFTEQLKKWNL